jgi:hypothetical protein
VDCDLVLMATNVMVEITKIIGIIEGEYTTVLNAEDTTILSGIQYDKRIIGKDEEVKVLRKIKKLNKFFQVNHVIVNSRGILFQGQVKERKNGKNNN